MRCCPGTASMPRLRATGCRVTRASGSAFPVIRRDSKSIHVSCRHVEGVNMQFSTMINTVAEARGDSAQLERLGYDALFTNESKHDPFVLAALMAEHTSKVELMTYIAVAFARTPMTVARAAHDVNSLARGRFTLGL